MLLYIGSCCVRNVIISTDEEIRYLLIGAVEKGGDNARLDMYAKLTVANDIVDDEL